MSEAITLHPNIIRIKHLERYYYMNTKMGYIMPVEGFSLADVIFDRPLIEQLERTVQLYGDEKELNLLTDYFAAKLAR